MQDDTTAVLEEVISRVGVPEKKTEGSVPGDPTAKPVSQKSLGQRNVNGTRCLGFCYLSFGWLEKSSSFIHSFIQNTFWNMFSSVKTPSFQYVAREH